MGELFAEIGHEIAVDPGKFGLEVVQFGLLVFVVWFVAVGFGKRRGMLVKMLEGRRARVSEAIGRARGMDSELAAAREKTAEITTAAHAEALAIVAEARRVSRAETKAARASADAEAAEIRAHAKEVLDAELAEMHVEIRDRLVDVVAHATRAILNEGLTMAEQRELIQNAVTNGIDRVDHSMPARASVAGGGEVAGP